MAPPDVPVTDIRDLSAHVGDCVRLRGWLYNRRGSKNLLFLVVRDGTGIVQCVVSQDEVAPEDWANAEQLTQVFCRWDTPPRCITWINGLQPV